MQAIEPYSQALDILQELANAARARRENPLDYKISVAHLKIADCYARTERASQALPHVRAALEIDQPRADADANNLTRLRKVYLDYVVLSYVYLSDSGKALNVSEQASVFEKAASLADRMAAADPNDARPLTDVRTAQLAWGDFLRDHNDAVGALARYRRALELAERQAAAAPATNQESLLLVHHRLARGFVSSDKPEEGSGTSSHCRRLPGRRGETTSRPHVVDSVELQPQQGERRRLSQDEAVAGGDRLIPRGNRWH